MPQTDIPIEPKYPRREAEEFPMGLSYNSGSWHVFPSPLAAN